MVNNSLMHYSQEFKDFLKTAKECNQSYAGHGNPNASILIVANEPGLVNDDFIKNDLERNREKWESNLFGKSMGSVEEMFDEKDKLMWEKFNPLWPYKGQRFTQIRVKKDLNSNTIRILNPQKRPTSRSWLQYQKLVDMIYNDKNECNRHNDAPLDFFEHAFITDFSAVYGKSSNEIDPEKREESISQRLPLFSTSFISHFPIIIVASGHYVRDIKQLNDLTKVFSGFDSKNIEQIDDAFGWRNVHYNNDRSRILIHTKHFASAISDEYLKTIAKTCSPLIK